MIKPTSSKIVTSSFKGDKESKSKPKKGYSPGKYAYSNHGNDEIKMGRSSVYDTRFMRKDMREYDPKHYVTKNISE